MTTKNVMATDEEREALLKAALVVLGIEMKPEWRDAVMFHLKVTEEHARLVLDFPLDETLEPAAIYIP